MKIFFQPGVAVGDRIIIEAETETDRGMLAAIGQWLNGINEVGLMGALKDLDAAEIAPSPESYTMGHRFFPHNAAAVSCLFCGGLEGDDCHRNPALLSRNRPVDFEPPLTKN